MNAEIRFSRIVIAIGLLSTATLAYEAALTRLLAVAQFYHFAFLIVSLALLGVGASGTFLAVFPAIKEHPLPRILSGAGIIFTLSIWVSYAMVNWLPFDSYSIAWDRKQILYFVLYYCSLSLPFLVSGLGLGAALSVVQDKHNQIYAANLLGSGLGVVFTPAVLSLAGLLGVVCFSGLLGIGSWAVLMAGRVRKAITRAAVSLAAVLGAVVLVWLSVLNFQGRSPLGLVISPYKGLASARRFPGAEHIFGKWQATSRVDVMSNAGTRSLPGMSYMYHDLPPTQLGLSIDGNALQPITLSSPADFSAAEWLPEAWAFTLTPHPDVLVLNPGAGLGILQAAAGKATSIQVVIEDGLILEGVRQTAPAYDIYQQPGVNVQVANMRAFLAGEGEKFDLIFLPLVDAYQPVTNGAYSFSENYTLTKEGMQAILGRLTADGLFLSSRWLQNPPSEGLRMVSTMLAALESLGSDNPQDLFVIYRGIQTMTAVVKPAGWDKEELSSLREFLDRCHFDLVWAPDLDNGELNRWNQLQEPIYYLAVKELFQAADREAFFRSYSYDIRAPTDDHPFFFHFFTWRQAGQIVANLGRTWQPFGGSGFLLLFLLLALVMLLSCFFILLPLSLRISSSAGPRSQGRIWVLLYFALIGTGFMFLEIPLISQWRLFLGTPMAAFSVVVGSLLISSGLGSRAASYHWSSGVSLLLPLVLAGSGFILFSTLEEDLLLSWPGWVRYLAPVLGLFPTGFLMGSFFPRGISWVNECFPGSVPWVWAVNGSTSVIASVVTAILSLQSGYSLVLFLGAVAYLAAWLILRNRSGLMFSCEGNKADQPEIQGC
jgi:hypothetical protein